MNMKKDTLGNASKANLQEAFRCGECLHFRQSKHLAHKELCCKEGVKTFAIAPNCFTPDVTQIAGNSDTFVQVATMFQAYTTKQQRILLAMLRKKTTKSKLAFGTKVIFHAMGKDYISNYLSAYVMGHTSSGELILGGSPDQKSRGKMFFAYMKDDEHLLTPAQWRQKKTALKEAGKVYDPSVIVSKRVADNDDVPSIDNAPKAWKDKQEKSNKKKGGVRPLDVLIIS